MVPDGAPDAAVAIARTLEQHGISYAIGGAIAYAFWGIPRATLDVDVNVFSSEAELDLLFDALRDTGVKVDAESARGAIARRGMFEAKFGVLRVDVFLPSIPFAFEAERTRKRQMLEGQEIWVLSAEAISIFKLLFFRPKDILDLERLIALQGDRLDRDYVRRHMVDMMGDEDERVRRWDALVAEHAPG